MFSPPPPSPHTLHLHALVTLPAAPPLAWKVFSIPHCSLQTIQEYGSEILRVGNQPPLSLSVPLHKVGLLRGPTVEVML